MAMKKPNIEGQVLELRQEIERIRALLREKKAEQNRVVTRCISATECKQAVFDEVDHFAQEGRAIFLRSAVKSEVDGVPVLPESTGINPHGTMEYLIKFLCFAVGDALKENLAKAIEANWPKDAISQEERKATMRRLEAEILEIEREEEGIIRGLTNVGISIQRRPDVLPEVVLQFDGKKWDQAVLRQINFGVQGLGRVYSDLIIDMNNFRATRLEKENSLRAVRYPPDQEGTIRAEIEKLKRREEEIKKDMEEKYQERQRLGQLYNSCLEFLKSRGIEP